MQQLAESCITDVNAARVRLESLHMTLLFLGERSVSEIERARDAARSVTRSRFKLRLKRCEFRARQAMVWLRGERSAALAGLVDDLRAGLQRAEVPFDLKPFLPHVTLARKVSSATEADCDLNWPAREFTLLRSAPNPGGSRYEAIERWPLNIETV